MSSYVLIIVVGWWTAQTGWGTTIQQDFATQATCEAAKESILKGLPSGLIRSQGCYQK